MQTESVKQTAAQKITTILDKLEIGKAIEAWQEAGDTLHFIIEENQKELDSHKKKLPVKEK
jgi:hypothetical protein